ncbi:MAG: hypothetical protein QM809_17205 [Gordonia sp. (in: high G+C Gram-positive bacteria)]|uniref:hypothetical protein n=1 Tax=Gordonia sp. (in: high G+C Gram-positive bacteria) TaxID=84139 RepID=UPI0039E69BC7
MKDVYNNHIPSLSLPDISDGLAKYPVDGIRNLMRYPEDESSKNPKYWSWRNSLMSELRNLAGDDPAKVDNLIDDMLESEDSDERCAIAETVLARYSMNPESTRRRLMALLTDNDQEVRGYVGEVVSGAMFRKEMSVESLRLLTEDLMMSLNEEIAHRKSLVHNQRTRRLAKDALGSHYEFRGDIDGSIFGHGVTVRFDSQSNMQ